MLFASLAVGIVAILFFVWRHRANTSRKLNFRPHSPAVVAGVVPLLGNITALTNAKKSILEYQQKFGTTFTIYVLKRWITVVCDPRHVKKIYRMPDDKVTSWPALATLFDISVRYGWKSGRFSIAPIVSALMTPSILRSQIDRINNRLHNQVQALFSGNDTVTVDFFKSISTIVTNMNILAFTTEEVFDACGTEIAESFYAVMNASKKPAPKDMVKMIFGMKLDRHYAFDRAVKKLDKFVQNEPRNDGAFSHIIEQARIELQKPENQDVDNATELVLHYIINFLQAAHINTLQTICYLLLEYSELDTQSEAYKQMSQEIDSISELSYDSVLDLLCVESSIVETIRKYKRSVVKGLRYAESDVPIGEHVIPKGNVIVLVPNGSENVFTQQATFKPERFVDEKVEFDKYLFTPFGRGRHSCAGERYAFLLVKTIVVKMIKECKIEVETKGYQNVLNEKQLFNLLNPLAPVMVKLKSLY
jgi:cytochrome P450